MPRKKQASLFVVATPIGNLKDITQRAIETLEGASFIVSENVRKTRNLLDHYGVKTPVRSYREANSRRAIPRIMKALRDGRDVALVAEAGTPGVSDPGRDLVDAAYRHGFRVVPVPGPSAAVAAASAAGMSESRFVFEGFLPRRKSRRVNRLAELAHDERLLVFFEAPHRLGACLADMADVLGDRKCLIAREITKIYEDMTRGSLRELAEQYAGAKPRGEFVIVCEGSSAAPPAAPLAQAADFDKIREDAMSLIRSGMKKSEAAKTIARRHGVTRKEVYSLLTGGPAGRREER
jgi:16S rRNA (cytidine1402-2'-O)-methyltransferase